MKVSIEWLCHRSSAKPSVSQPVFPSTPVRERKALLCAMWVTLQHRERELHRSRILKSDKFIKRRPLNEPARSAFAKDSQRRNKVIKGESIQCDAICVRHGSIQTDSAELNGFLSRKPCRPFTDAWGGIWYPPNECSPLCTSTQPFLTSKNTNASRLIIYKHTYVLLFRVKANQVYWCVY